MIKEIIKEHFSVMTLPDGGTADEELDECVSKISEFILSQMKEKEKYVTNKIKPSIQELQEKLDDKGYEILPDGEIKSIDKESVGYNQCRSELVKILGEEGVRTNEI